MERVLTVVTKGERSFVVEVSPETLSVTTLGQLTGGAPVNLERAMRLNERIGGHLVQGMSMAWESFAAVIKKAMRSALRSKRRPTFCGIA